jgi:diguanylate cyclase (GGDEF)-like protein
MRSFRNRLLILLIGLVVGAQSVTLFTALARTSATERQRADEQLVAGGQVAAELIRYRQRQLASAVSVLAADFGIREAVASSDRATVASALGNHAARIGANLTLAIDLDGGIIATGEGSPTLDMKSSQSLLQGFSPQDSAPRFVAVSGLVYQIFVAPVRAPDVIAWVALGFALDKPLADQIRKLIHVDVMFVTTAEAQMPAVVGTLQHTSAIQNEMQPLLGHELPATLPIGDTDYLGTSVRLSNAETQVHIVLLKPMSEVLDPYRKLSRSLWLIVGATLLAAIVAGFLLGRSAAQPILLLAANARRIARGDYTVPVDTGGAQELVELATAFNAMQQGIAEREAKLMHGTLHDEATGLPNRVHAERWLNERLVRLAPDESIAVVLVAATNLQELSAALGFEMSQRIVVRIATALKRWYSESTFVARFDSARFAVLMAGRQIDSRTLANQLREVVSEPIHTSGITLTPAATAGVALAPLHGTNAAELLRCAEAATETAMRTHARIGIFEKTSDDMQRRRLRIGADLPLALAANQLHLHYQPKVAISTRRAVSAEVLARWHHPEFGDISPLEFVAVAEQTGASATLTRWVLKSALKQLAAWRGTGLDVELAVNLSATDIADPDLLEYILDCLRNVRLPAGALTLEITESAFMNDADAAIRNMELLCVAGVRFSVDDFGTGYSSLSQLRQLAVDELKIDRSFIKDMKSEGDEIELVRSVINLGHGLGLRIVAEGVETEAQWRLLAKMGCDYAQGYLVSKPVLPDEFARFAKHTASHTSDDAGATAVLHALTLRREA